MNSDCDSLVTVYDSSKEVYWSLTLENNFLNPVFGWDYLLEKRRQDLPFSFTLNGAIYITTIANFIENNSLLNKRTIPYVMTYEQSIDIDKELDFLIAELLMKKSNEGYE